MSAESTEHRLTQLETFASDVRELTRLVTELLRRHDERLDTFDATLSDLTAKIEALADAQINTESSLSRLADAQVRTEERLNTLIDRIG